MNDEFLNAIEKSELSASTITTYTSNYKRLMGFLQDEPILCFTEARIIKRLKELEIPPMSINGLVSVILLVRRSVHLTTKKIEKYREVLSKDHYTQKEVNNEELKEQLVSIEELNEHINQLLTNRDYTAYIINYLIVRYGLRNMDLDFRIVKDKSMGNNKTNYIYLTKKYAMYVINQYKTRSTYGVKKLKIVDSDFRRVIKKLLDDKDEYEFINANNVNKFIQHRTYNGLGEGKIFKSIISELADDGDIKRIKELGETRGTEITTIFNDYQVDL